MPRIFQRLVKGGRRSGFTGDPRVCVAAFGKHPGWDDHIPGIGLDTEVLAELKQSFYVGGIGAEIDSGSWERLEPEKRLEGFDHTFAWLRDFDVVLGQLWSSSDRKGRAKYPMVICVHAEGVAPAALLGAPLDILSRLRTACQQTQSADAVQRACQSAQEAMTAWLDSAGPEAAQPGATFQEKRQFLDHPALGPDFLGLSRVFHELDNAFGRPTQGQFGSGTVDVRPSHVRVPLCADSAERALILWIELLNIVIPPAAPVLLLARQGTAWLDLVIGSGRGEDLFCLQASTKALPLATEVPYDLSPEVLTRLRQAESEFLRVETSVSPLTPVAPSEPQPRPIPVVPPVTPPVEDRPRPRGQGWVAMVAGVGVVLAGGAFLIPKLLQPREVRTAQPPTPAPPQPPIQVPTAAPPTNAAYAQAIAAAQSFLRQGNWDGAEQQAQVALVEKPDDSTARQLLAEAEKGRQSAARNAADEQIRREIQSFKITGRDAVQATNWADAMSAWKEVVRRAEQLKDERQRQEAGKELQYVQAILDASSLIRQTNWAGARQQAQLALSQKPDDPVARSLLAEVEQGSQAAAYASAQENKRRELEAFKSSAREAVQKRDWTVAITAWKAAASRAEELKDDRERQDTSKELLYVQAVSEAEKLLQAGNWDGAHQRAQLALTQKPNDPVAADLVAQVDKARQASAAKAAQEHTRRELDSFRAAAQAAVLKKDWGAATAAWQEALRRAEALKDDSQRQTAAKELQFIQAVAQAHQLVQQRNWDDAEQQAQLALAQKPNDPLATGLLAQVQQARRAAVKAAEEKKRRDAEAAETARQEAIRRKLEEQRRAEPATVPTVEAAVGQNEYDDVLAVLEVRLGLRKEDPSIVERSDGKPAQPLPASASLSRAERNELDRKLRFLEDQFRKKGVPPDRLTRLRQVAEAIRSRK